MGCKKAIVKTAKAAWKILGPDLVRRIATVVEVLDQDGVSDILTNHDKRRVVVEDIRSEAQRQGREFREWAVRMAIEHTLRNLREGIPPEEIADVLDETETMTV